MDLWFTMLITALLGLLGIIIGRRYLKQRARANAWNGEFPPPKDRVWKAMQAAFKVAIQHKPIPQADALLDEDGLYLTSLELLEFLLALEEELKLRIATENLPDSALLSLSALHAYVSALRSEQLPENG